MLKNIAQEIHAKIFDLRYFFRLLYVPMRTLLSFQKERKVIMHPPQQKIKLLHYLISRLCVFDYFFLPKCIYGTSIICNLNVSQLTQ